MQGENVNLASVVQRLEKLEGSQKATVQSALDEVRHFSRSSMFCKDRALDYLISLKIVAKESKHPKAGYYSAVLHAIQEKTHVSDFEFKQYLQALVGDKDHEEVLKCLASVDKAMRFENESRPFRPRGRGRGRGRVQNRSFARCFMCNEFGHYQRFCRCRAFFISAFGFFGESVSWSTLSENGCL